MNVLIKILLQELDKLLKNNNSDNNFIIDIGASYNSFFIKYNYNGVLFDKDGEKLKKLSKTNLYKKITKKITPDNVISELRKHNTPTNFLVLNLDIDSYDLFVLINILKYYSPEIIISEINEKIPPSIKFSVNYHKGWSWKGDHFFGYSISCLEPVLKHFGYRIHKLIYNNVILVKNDSKINIEGSYKDGYLMAKSREELFNHNADVEYWQGLNPKKLKKEIREYFNKYKGKYVIGKKCENLIKKYIKEKL